MSEAAPLRDRPHGVYVCWGKNGRPLYVGCSSEVDRRLWSHLNEQGWWPEVDHTEVLREFPDQADAWAEERRLIVEMRPTYNGNIHVPTPQWDLDTYLRVLNAGLRHAHVEWLSPRTLSRIRQVKQRFGVSLPRNRPDLLAYIDAYYAISTREPIEDAA